MTCNEYDVKPHKQVYPDGTVYESRPGKSVQSPSGIICRRNEHYCLDTQQNISQAPCPDCGKFYVESYYCAECGKTYDY